MIPTPVEASSATEERQPLLETLSTKLLPELKRYVKNHRGQVHEMINSADERSGLLASQRYARVVDGLVSSLFHAARTAMNARDVWVPVAFAAVGSYGRSSLSIYSDLDVRILSHARPEEVQPIAEALLYPLWDVGLSIGHQVLDEASVIELAGTDLPTATSLLDWRHLGGEAQLSKDFLERVFQEVFAQDKLTKFIERLSKTAGERRQRFGSSVFLLEPEVKNGAGGLRDLDLAHWAARARWRVNSLQELVKLGVLLPAEWEEIEQAIEFVMRVRNTLHVRAKRRLDRLGFEDQEHLSGVLGYGAGGAAVEAFMSDYYRHAREIQRTSEMLLRRAVPPPKRKPAEKSIDFGLRLIGERIALADVDQLHTDPALAFRLYTEAVERGARLTSVTRRAIMRATATEGFCQRLRESDEAVRSFRSLVCDVRIAAFSYGSILTELHDVGLLLAMIPEFAPVVGRVHHDVYHVYTVDVHSIAAVDLIRELQRGDHSDAQGLAMEVARSTGHSETLTFATLLHDVGKDEGGKDHAKRGAMLADGILKRLKFEPDEIQRVKHLIEIHLRMYLVATRRDIDDPRTLERFGGEVDNSRALQDLFLLTTADVSTTSSSGLTSWKRRMLEELYHATYGWLEGRQSRRAAAEISVQRALKNLPEGVPEELAQAFLESLPARYHAANDSEWIARHLSFIASHAEDDIAMEVLRVGTPHVELAVLADDQPGALARVCAMFSHRKMKVVSAQIFTWKDASGRRRALDIFWVRSGTESRTTQGALPELTEQLTQLTSGKLSTAALVSGNPQQARWSNRVSPEVPIQVRVDNSGATSHTILEVITKDRADLLFWVCESIREAGLSIALAKIHTEGERVTDVFYVSTSEGKKLDDAAAIGELKNNINLRLQAIEADKE